MNSQPRSTPRAPAGVHCPQPARSSHNNHRAATTGGSPALGVPFWLAGRLRASGEASRSTGGRCLRRAGGHRSSRFARSPGWTWRSSAMRADRRRRGGLSCAPILWRRRPAIRSRSRGSRARWAILGSMPPGGGVVTLATSRRRTGYPMARSATALPASRLTTPSQSAGRPVTPWDACVCVAACPRPWASPSTARRR